MRKIAFLPALLLFVIVINAKGIHNPKNSNSKLLAPLSFIENKGQVTDQNLQPRTDIDFSIKAASGLTIFVGKGRIHYQFCKADPTNTPKKGERDTSSKMGRNITQPSLSTSFSFGENRSEVSLYRMDVALIGANTNAKIVKEEQLDFYENYVTSTTLPFQGGKRMCDAYTRITYKDIYPNIDWVLYIKNGLLEHEFVINEGGNASDIKLIYGGATDLKINADGSLIASTPQGTITEHAPSSYQADGSAIKSSFVLINKTLTYSTGNYKGKLVIDPSLTWGTYFGGSGYEQGYGTATDASGNVFITGFSPSTSGIATTGAYQTTLLGSQNAFLAKFNTTGIIQWATYYGGGGESSNAVATDKAGNVYITGATNSPSVIATVGAYQTTLTPGGQNAFLAKFNSSGAIVWATYYGGGTEVGNGVATDTSGNVFITGVTTSTVGVATTGAYQTVLPSSGASVFLTKFNSSGAIQWGTYYGGTSLNRSFAITTDITGNVFITGYTYSSTGIATSGSYQTTLSGSENSFLAKFNTLGNIKWATYYGGGNENGNGVATDGTGNVYITGITYSSSGIATPGAYQTTFLGSFDDFLAKFDSTGTLQWGTYYGGGRETGSGVATDGSGHVYITGYTQSTVGIATTGAYKTTLTGNPNGFIADFSSSGSLIYATYYGGTSNDFPQGIATDNNNNVYIVGTTSSIDSIATIGSYQESYGGSNDAFLAKFNFSPTSVSPASVGICTGGSATLTASYSSTYSWSPTTGLSATTGATVVAHPTVTTTYTVTGVLGFDTVTVTINPYPNLGAIASQTVCNAALTTSVAFTSTVTGTTYTWTNSNTTIGLSATGSGTSIASFTVVNTASANDTAVITVTPSALGCVGVAKSFSIAVFPTPYVGGISGLLIVCPTSTITLTDSLPGGAWTASNGNASVNTSGIVTGNIAGIDTISYTFSNACGSKDTFSVITILPAPYTGVITGDTMICMGATDTLRDTATGGTWSYVLGLATVSVTGLATGVSTGTDTVKYTVTNSCGTAVVHIQMIVNPSPTITATPDTTICAGLSATLTATGGISYSWVPSSGLLATTGATIIADPLSTKIYTVTGTDVNACHSIAVLTVTVLPQPYAAPIGGAIAACLGLPVTLTDASSGGLWTASNGNVSLTLIFSNSSVIVGNNYGMDTITYAITNTCGTKDTFVVLNVDSLPVVSPIAGLSIVCLGSEITLTDAAVGGIWLTAIGNASVVPTPTGGIVSGITAGTDTVFYIISSPNCGDATASSIITVSTLPATPVITVTDSTLSVPAVYTTYQWYEHGSPISGATNASYHTLDTGSYFVIVTNSSSCATVSATDDVNKLAVANIGSNGNIVSIYPDPATTVVYIKSITDVDARLTTIDGRMLIEQKRVKKLDVGSLPHGVYIINVYNSATEEMIMTQRVVKVGE